LTQDGWLALQKYGINAIIHLKTAGQTADWDEEPSVPGIDVRTLVVEDLNDPQFVELCMETGVWCTPLYFPLMLTHWPSVCVDIVSAVAATDPGAIVITSDRGRDRTGLAAFLLLALAEVDPDDIAADWELSAVRLRMRIPNYDQLLADLLDQNGTSVVRSLRETCGHFNVAELLVSHGLTRQDVDRVRQRLLGGGNKAHTPSVITGSTSLAGGKRSADGDSSVVPRSMTMRMAP
jgi:hypothetical protein